MRATRRRPRGFTTMEALVGAAVALGTLASTVVFLQTQLRAITLQNGYATNQALTRTAVDLLARELRMAGHDPRGTALPVSAGPSCPGASRGLVEAGVRRLRFQQDLDGDGAIAAAGEDVTYYLDGDRLVRQDGEALPLVDGLARDGVEFRYFDAGSPGTELAADTADTRACIARVRLTLATPAATVATEVAIRSRALLRF